MKIYKSSSLIYSWITEERRKDEENGSLNGEVLSTSGSWSLNRRRRSMRGISPRIKDQKWLEGRWISSSRFYSLRIKQKPKLLKLRSRLSWIHARVLWTGVALLSGSRDPLCSSWTPRRNNNSIRLKASGTFMFRLFHEPCASSHPLPAFPPSSHSNSVF